MIIDAKNLILGRMATFVAKKALLGEKVSIINCEKAVITGNRKQIFARYKQKREMGRPTKGPFIPRRPDMFVKRTLRGMLPYKQPKGKDALGRIKCYMGIPEEFKEKEVTKIEQANSSKLPNLKFVPVKQICEFMGAKTNA